MRRAFRRALLAGAAGTLCLSALLQAAPANTPVADAAERRDHQTVRALLTRGGDVNAAQGDGMTALHWAAANNDVELIRTLLYAGANVKAITRLGNYTPLILAARNGHAAAVAALVEAGADVRAVTSNGATPLMLAAASGNADAVIALLDHGAEVNATEPARGQTALMFAAAANRAAVIEVLTKRGADVKVTSKVIDLAALSRDEQALRAITLGNPPPPPKEGEKPEQSATRGAASRKPALPGVDRQFFLNELVTAHGGLTPLLYATRQGYVDSVQALLTAGADVNQVSAGDQTSPLLMAVINGHFDVAKLLLDKGADPRLASENGASPLYAALNVQWAPKALYPQPRAYLQQSLGYLDLMKMLLEKGADPDARLRKKVWYSGYSFDLSGVDEIGATAFWRAAYASDVDAMRLLIAHGADPDIRTIKPAGRPRTGDGGRETVEDVSGLPPLPVGGPGVTPLQAAAGVGYGEGFAANAHRFAPIGQLAAVRYLVEELHADVNAADHEGNTALHQAAARGDVEMIKYLVSKGANVQAVNREGQTTADMANGPVQRIQPFPAALDLLVKLGAKNNNKCVSC